MAKIKEKVENEENKTDFIDLIKDASKTFVQLAGVSGIAGFVFDQYSDESIRLENDITDHYVEDGTSVQDHIAIKPEIVTVRGYIGEYKNIVKGKKSGVENATQKLVTVASYGSALSSFANQTISKLNYTKNGFELTDKLGSATDLFELYRNINIPSTEQAKAFLYFEALRNSRSLFTIKTPFRYYTGMAIQKIEVIQEEKTRDVSDFSITFKRIRKVSTKTTGFLKVQGRLKAEISSLLDKGKTKIENIDTTGFKNTLKEVFKWTK